MHKRVSISGDCATWNRGLTGVSTAQTANPISHGRLEPAEEDEGETGHTQSLSILKTVTGFGIQIEVGGAV